MEKLTNIFQTNSFKLCSWILYKLYNNQGLILIIINLITYYIIL